MQAGAVKAKTAAEAPRIVGTGALVLCAAQALGQALCAAAASVQCAAGATTALLYAAAAARPCAGVLIAVVVVALGLLLGAEAGSAVEVSAELEYDGG
jgi:hypothetical protein